MESIKTIEMVLQNIIFEYMLDMVRAMMIHVSLRWKNGIDTFFMTNDNELFYVCF